MISQTVPWGDDVHRFVRELLLWHENARLACCSRAFRYASLTRAPVTDRIWWGQAVSTKIDVESLLESLECAKQALTPSCRPNLAMLMIDSQVLWTTTMRGLCERLHLANIVPVECPVVVLENDSGVFGTGVSGEAPYTTYEGRDVSFNPAPAVTAVLTVGYIPPERDSKGGVRSRVRCFIVDDQPHNRRRVPLTTGPTGIEPILMQCAPTQLHASSGGPIPIGVSVPTQETSPSPEWEASQARAPAARDQAPAEAAVPAGKAQSAAAAPQQSRTGNAYTGLVAAGRSSPGTVGSAPRLRRSSRVASTARSTHAARPPRTKPKLLPPSTSVPLDDADTVVLVAVNLGLLRKTTTWLETLLPKAVILGGLAGSALIIGDQVFGHERSVRTQVPHLVGLALRDVHAMMVSVRGFDGVGPVFRLDDVAQTQRGPSQAQPGRFVRHVSVVAEADGRPNSRATSAQDILRHELPRESLSDGTAFAVAANVADLLRPRAKLDGDSNGDATGTTPTCVLCDGDGDIELLERVEAGQYARFMLTRPELVLEDTTAAYELCRRRIEKDGGGVLSSLRFTCNMRPERLDMMHPPPLQNGHEPAGDDGIAPTFETALHQQEAIRFCKAFNAPVAEMFCGGELGPASRLIPGIIPRTARAGIFAYTSSAAVLCWNPAVSA